MNCKNKKISFAKLLINIGCLQVSPGNPFTYASGLKGPIYCDNRKVLSFISERNKVATGLVDLVVNQSLSFDVVAGLATAGVPHGMLLADRIEKPFIYIRGKAKAHGKNNQVEGQYEAGQKVLMVEDLVNQGKSLKDAVIGTRESGLFVSDVLSIVDYQMKNARSVLSELDLCLYSLTDFDSICEAALEMSKISKDEYEELKRWQADPASWRAL